MDIPSIPELVERHLWAARAAEHGRSAELIIHDGVLRQTLLALASGSRLSEHNAPPAASLQVLLGRIALTTESGEMELSSGQISRIPQERHGVEAREDSVFLLTAVTSVPEELRAP
ncbi:cupin [Brachybacterium hainanense]|uniref:Cupin n=1 Tax=Brachybacterium hainanense TaxID=1541174 RepID=A0ABV6RHU9_9MICO